MATDRGPFDSATPTPEQATAMLGVRLQMKGAYDAIVDLVPACAERTLAMRALEEAGMWANKAISFDGERYLDTGAWPPKGA